MATDYEKRNLAPHLMSALNRLNALGLTGFPFASAAALVTAAAALSTSAQHRPTRRRIAESVDKELTKYNSVGILTSAVFGAATIAAARTAVAAFYAPGSLSTNHCAAFLGD